MSEWGEHDEIAVLDHGYVALVDVMGNDRTPARTARTSYRNRIDRTPEDDARLTRYLVRNRHTTPLEFCQILFYMKLPIFVARQIVRHRTASINEISLRYVKAAREFYVPAPERCQRQATDNKQGSSSQVVDHPSVVRFTIQRAGDVAFDAYERLLAAGLAAELARSVLPLGTYTEWYWRIDLHNLLHFLRLRLDPHAQWEVREYAGAALRLVRGRFPTVVAAWAEMNGIAIDEKEETR